MVADIAGYSALMSADEEGTFRDLKGHQQVVLPMISTAAKPNVWGGASRWDT